MTFEAANLTSRLDRFARVFAEMDAEIIALKNENAELASKLRVANFPTEQATNCGKCGARLVPVCARLVADAWPKRKTCASNKGASGPAPAAGAGYAGRTGSASESGGQHE